MALLNERYRRVAVWGVIIVVAAVAVGVALRGQGIPVQVTRPTVTAVREYVAEDAKTRLDETYVVDMPVSGTLERVALEIGDYVDAGDLIAHIDPYDLRQQIHEIDAQIAEANAQIIGVDVAKPKKEDIETAAVQIEEAQATLEISQRERASLHYQVEEARKAYERAKGLVESGAGTQAAAEDAELKYLSLRESLSRAEVASEAAKKRLEQAKLAYARILDSIDDNEYERQALLASIDALKARLARLKEDLGKTEIHAPVSGPIIEKFVEDRRVLTAGSPILEIGDLNTIEIESDILSEEIGRVRVGQNVEITGKSLQGRGLEYPQLIGVVRQIYPSGFKKISALGVEQQRVKTIIAFDNSQAQLLPETSVDIKIITAESPDTLAVPDRAAFRREGQWYVFRIEDGRAKQTPVELGLRNDDWAEILEGLSEDDTVIAELKNELEDNVRVSPMTS